MSLTHGKPAKKFWSFTCCIFFLRCCCLLLLLLLSFLWSQQQQQQQPGGGATSAMVTAMGSCHIVIRTRFSFLGTVTPIKLLSCFCGITLSHFGTVHLHYLCYAGANTNANANANENASAIHCECEFQCERGCECQSLLCAGCFVNPTITWTTPFGQLHHTTTNQIGLALGPHRKIRRFQRPPLFRTDSHALRTQLQR